MPAKGKISIRWQIVLTFLIPYYEFYRIKKLRRGVVIILIFSAILIGLTVINDPRLSDFPKMSESEKNTSLLKLNASEQEGIISSVPFIVNGVVSVAVKLYYLWKWSKEWNNQFTEIR